MIKTTFWLLITLGLSVPALSQESAQWRGPNRDGIYPETGLLNKWPAEGPELLWHYDDLGNGHGSAAVIRDKIFVAGTRDDEGFIVALSPDGSTLWRSVYGKEWVDGYEGVRTTPLYIEGYLYLMSGLGVVYCLDADNGTEIWQADLLNEFQGNNIKWGMTENLLVDGDRIFCTPGGEQHNVIALNRLDGSLIWSCPGLGEISAYCSPALFDHNGRKILATHTEKSILGIDALTGKLLWTVEQPNKYSVHANTPLYREGWLYCVSGYGKGGIMLEIAENGESVREIWRDEELDTKLGGMVELNGRIYGSGDFNRKWYCLDWKTGTELFRNTDFTKGNIISAEGLLYWYTQGGEVVLIRPLEDRFEILGSFKVPFGEKQHWAHLVIHDKRLFVRHGSALMVYDIQIKQ
jgi:outer membrane protein assembly factor BamB